jgi:hypothetical protein
MKVKFLTTVAVLLFTRCAFAQNPSCRQTWMPTDAPAFCAWQPEPSLPEARTYHAVVLADDNIYVLGGFRFDASTNQVIYYDSVARSGIGADGHLSAWTAEPSFKTARSGEAALAIGRCLFLAGGSSSTPTSLNYYDDVQSANISSDGHISSWTTSPNHLAIPRSNLSLTAVTTAQGTFLNAVAGVAQIGQDTVHLDTIEVAKVGANCTVGPWALADYHLKGGRSSPQALAIRDSTVVIGGWGDLDLIDVYDDVQVSAARADGSPSPWRTSTSHLTTGIYGHATVFAGPEAQSGSALLLSVGGQPGTGAYANWVSYAYVARSGAPANEIGIWRIAPTGRLTTGRAGLGAVQAHGRLYVIGGNDASGQYYNSALSAQFDFGKP